jgi:hypothetical protein
MPKEASCDNFVFSDPHFSSECLFLPDKNEDICSTDILPLPDWNTDDYILREPKV